MDKKTINILVIEHQQHELKRIVDSLVSEPDFHVVGTESDNLDAIEKAKILQPDIILVSIALSKIDDIESFNDLREAFPKSAIICMAHNVGTNVGKDDIKEFIHQMKATGMRFFVQKPVNIAQLHHLIRNVYDYVWRREQIEFKVMVVVEEGKIRENVLKLLSSQPDIKLVGTALKGQDAIEQVVQAEPHIIVMDVNLPDMDCLEAFAQIRSIAPDVEVAMLSSTGDSNFMQKAMNAGIRCILETPFYHEEYLADDPLATNVRTIYSNQRFGSGWAYKVTW